MRWYGMGLIASGDANFVSNVLLHGVVTPAWGVFLTFMRGCVDAGRTWAGSIPPAGRCQENALRDRVKRMCAEDDQRTIE